MKQFAIFWVLVLYNFELKQNIPVIIHKTHLVVILKSLLFMLSCTLTKICIIVKSNHQNRIIVFWWKRSNKRIYICSLGCCQYSVFPKKLNNPSPLVCSVCRLRFSRESETPCFTYGLLIYVSLGRSLCDSLVLKDLEEIGNVCVCCHFE